MISKITMIVDYKLLRAKIDERVGESFLENRRSENEEQMRCGPLL